MGIDFPASAAIGDLYSGYQFDGAIWQPPALSLRSMVHRNRLDNADFKIQHRPVWGTAGFNGDNGYMCDRWRANYLAADFTAVRTNFSDTVPPPADTTLSAFVRLTAVRATVNATALYQRMPTWLMIDLAGRPVTLSFWVRSSTPLTSSFYLGLVNPLVSNNFATYGTPIYQPTISMAADPANTWVRKTWTLVLPAAYNLGCQFGFYTPAGQANGSVLDVTGFQMELGTVASPNEVRPWTDEREACALFYQRGTCLCVPAPTGSLSAGYWCLHFATQMWRTPTLVYWGTTNVVNTVTSQPGGGSAALNGGSITVNNRIIAMAYTFSTIAGQYASYFYYFVDAEI